MSAGETLEQIRIAHGDELFASVHLVDALNARLNDAVQFVIGVTSADLQQMFLALRRALKGQARLVLLLEDITAWQGLDNGLIDALVVDADTRPDICPMISVVGVTPEYHDDLRKNYADRITHEIQLADTTAGSAEAVTLRAAADRHAFSARYLNATRAGVTELATWRAKLDANPQSRPPNPCLDCGHRDPCHAAFGKVGEIGLYPFSERSIDNLFYALKADDKGQTHRTPRGLLQSVLGPTLRHPGMLDRRGYPGADIETEKLDERVGFLPGALGAIVEARELPEPVKERLRRTLVYWGDKHRPLTTTGKDGKLRFAEVPRPVFEAFGLPWIGDETGARVAEPSAPGADPPSTPAPAAVAAPATSNPAPDAVPVAAPAPADTAAGQTSAAPAATGPTPSPPPIRQTNLRSVASKAKLQRLRGFVTAARAGGQVGEGGLWNEVLFEILGLVDPRSVGVDPWTWDDLFTTNLVQLERTVQARSASFAIPRKTWVYDGVDAYCALSVGGEPAEIEEYHRRRLALMLRRLGRLAAAHASRRRPPAPDGGEWDMAASASQTLLARAWLKGAVSPLASTAEQWRVILSDETEADTDPQSRTDAWRDALRNSNQQHKNLRTMLRDMTSLPQGASADYGVADAGSAALAIVRLQRRMSFLPISEAPTSAAWLDDKGLRTTAAKMRDYLGRIATFELKRLEERAGALGELLRGEAVSARAQRLNRAITEVLPQIRELPADHETRWRSDWERAKPLLETSALVGNVQALITAFRNPDTIPSGPPERLAWLIEQPAGELRQLLELLRAGDELARLLADRAEDYAKAAAAGGDLTALHLAGETLTSAVAAAKAAWSAPP